MITEEKTIDSERIYDGVIIDLRRDLVITRGGRTSWREIVEHNGGVAIAALTGEGKMVIVKQYRKAAEQVVLEVPAGKIEKGEEHAVAARRELLEETGYSAERMEHLMAFYASIGFCTEVIHLYMATGLTPGETCFDDNEDIEVLEYGLEELLVMVNKGDIIDAKTIIAIQTAVLSYSDILKC